MTIHTVYKITQETLFNMEKFLSLKKFYALIYGDDERDSGAGVGFMTSQGRAWCSFSDVAQPLATNFTTSNTEIHRNASDQNTFLCACCSFSDAGAAQPLGTNFTNSNKQKCTQKMQNTQKCCSFSDATAAQPTPSYQLHNFKYTLVRNTENSCQK